MILVHSTIVRWWCTQLYRMSLHARFYVVCCRNVRIY